MCDVPKYKMRNGESKLPMYEEGAEDGTPFWVEYENMLEPEKGIQLVITVQGRFPLSPNQFARILRVWGPIPEPERPQ